MRFLVVMLVVIVIVCSRVMALAITTKPPDPDWYEHLDIIIPGVIYAIKMMGALISLLLTMLGAMVVYGFKATRKTLNDALHKINYMHYIMMNCEGCKNSINQYDRRKDADVTDNIEDILP